MLKRIRAFLNREVTLTKENPFRVILYTFAIIGYISTVNKAYQESQEMYIGLLVASVLVTLAVIFFVQIDYVGDIRPPTRQARPKAALAIEPADNERPYRITVPTSRQIAEGVIEKSQIIFGKDAIDPEEDMENFLNDRYSLIALTNQEKKIHGFIDFYAFKTEHYELFINGEFDFDELLHQSLANHPEARRASAIHISTLVNMSYLLDSVQRQRSRENQIIIWGAVSAILAYQQFPPQGLDIFSIGWSKSGEKAMRMFGMTQVGTVLKGSSLGKPIYGRRGVQPTDIIPLVERGKEDFSEWCDLQLQPLKTNP